MCIAMILTMSTVMMGMRILPELRELRERCYGLKVSSDVQTLLEDWVPLMQTFQDFVRGTSTASQRGDKDKVSITDVLN